MGEKNNVLNIISAYLTERQWSLYRLAKESGITYSSLHSMIEKNTQPTISTLEKICDGLGITLSEFFQGAEDIKKVPFFTSDEKTLLDEYRNLSIQDKKLLQSLLQRLCKEKQQDS